MYLVTINAEKCEGCEECANNCPVSVFEMQNGKATIVSADSCEGCETCVSVCSSGAVTLSEM
ncbi:MAG: 4Fe-4S dicluster domain-containing protein [Nitrospirota bacterium]